jgi:very-short-patch-repair endonuclease
MKRLDINDIDWQDVQRKHDEGLSLGQLGLSRKMIDLGVKEGLFKKNIKPHKWTDEEKRNLSEKRKDWLRKNPEKHVWRRNNKFTSTPCEMLKKSLIKKGIKIEEEVQVSFEKNYSVDILIPDKNLIVEVNGNQHYDKNGNLLPYYKERHEHIKSLGWNIIEIHYTMAFNVDLCISLIETVKDSSIILPFAQKERKEKKIHGSREKAVEARRKTWEMENLKYVKLVEDSNIDFSKYGWVTDVSKIIGQKPQKVNSWMKRMMPDFFEEKCFKRK